jgi:uncharacterized protein YecE (DUF72 family)
MKPRVYIGTSGWVYKHWHQSFYPEDLPRTDQLTHYSTQFPTVEINATFYRLPTENMVRGWYDRAPKEFIYAVKGSRLITHFRRLKNIRAELKTFFKRIAPLGGHLGPVLWQLPPNFAKDLDRLAHFLSHIPKEFQHAIEFRHPSWISLDTFDLLQTHRVAHVWLSSQRMPTNFTVTSSFVYLRFHGLEGGPGHDYTEEELAPWAQALVQQAEKRHRSFVYFNNDWNTRAPENARLLMELTQPHTVHPQETTTSSRGHRALASK